MKIKELINANKIYSKPKINGNNLTQKENEHKTKNTSLLIKMKIQKNYHAVIELKVSI